MYFLNWICFSSSGFSPSTLSAMSTGVCVCVSSLSLCLPSSSHNLLLVRQLHLGSQCVGRKLWAAFLFTEPRWRRRPHLAATLQVGGGSTHTHLSATARLGCPYPVAVRLGLVGNPAYVSAGVPSGVASVRHQSCLDSRQTSSSPGESLSFSLSGKSIGFNISMK